MPGLAQASCQLTRVRDANSRSAKGWPRNRTKYTYDPFGNLTQILDPAGNPTTRSFDALGYQLTATSDYDRGSWTYQFDSLGELLNVRDAKTTAPTWTQQLTYDALGRTLTRVETEGTTTWTWGTSQAAHEIGQLKQLAGLGDTETYTFDSAGRPYTRSMAWGGLTYTVTYTYNTLRKLDQLVYPLAPGQANPFAVKYGYTDGYVSSLQNYTGGVGGTTFWKLTPSVVNMDPWGHVVDETLGTTSAVRIQSGYDAVTSWQASRTVGSGGSLTNLDNMAFQWDLNGNLSQRQDITNSLTEALTYDNLNRIQNSTLNGTTQILAMVYDNTGNITSRTEYGSAYPYTYDTVHKHGIKQLGSPAVHTYTYDANGNMASRDSLGFIWASYNLPTSVTSSGVSASFYYGPDRQRKEQVSTYNAEGDSGTETTTYVFGLYEHESTPAQTHDKYFVQVPGGTQIIYDIQSVSGTQTTYATSDHLGSANLMINAAGSVVLRESYGAFGRRRAANWASNLASTASDYNTIASTTRRGYTDAFHEYLDNVTLIHMNGRVYDPVAGRFLSPDPMAVRSGNSQMVNPYSYVANRSLTLTDPSGFCPTDPNAPCLPNNPDYAPITFPGVQCCVDISSTRIWSSGVVQLAPVPPPLFSMADMATIEPIPPPNPAPFKPQPKGKPQGNQNQSPTCWATGISFSFSTINPFTSGGGGTYGLNIEWTKGTGLAVYTYGTPNTTPSQGFLLGAGVSLNAATGRGPWSGLFDSTTGAYGPVNGGFFESPPGGEDPGFFGLEIGAGPGLPGVGSTTTNYTPVLQLTHPAPNGCTKGH